MNCAYCGEEIPYGDWIYEDDNGDAIESCCFGDWCDENYELLGFKKKRLQANDDPWEGRNL